MLDFIADPWRTGIGVRAFAEVVLLGLACGPIGFWIVAYRLSYGAESLSHSLLPGLVLATAAGLSPLIGAAAAAAVAAALIAAASARDERVGSDTAIAVVVTGLVGLGALLALAPDTPRQLSALLFGDPLAASDADLIAAAILLAAGGAALAALHRPLAAALFDPPASPSLGFGSSRVQFALLVLMAAAVCVAAQGLGSLLALGVFVAPALAVGARARSVAGALIGSAAIAAAAGVIGLYASYHLGIAAGASVVLALCLAVLVATALPTPARRAAGS